MARTDIVASMARVSVLAEEIEERLPGSSIINAEIRADLAGLLAVLTCASYESCVKAIISEYASRHHELFGLYTESKYDRINSRINMNDLHAYAKTFHPEVGKAFKTELARRKTSIAKRFSVDIEKAYEQLLKWRHDFAHTGARVTTVEEVLRTHIFAQRVILSLDKAFCSLEYKKKRKRK